MCLEITLADGTRAFCFIAAMLISGCVHEDPLPGPQFFRPDSLLQSELNPNPGQLALESIIIPIDIASRPGLQRIIIECVTIKNSQSTLDAVTFIDEALGE